MLSPGQESRQLGFRYVGDGAGRAVAAHTELWAPGSHGAAASLECSPVAMAQWTTLDSRGFLGMLLPLQITSAATNELPRSWLVFFVFFFSFFKSQT